MSDLKELLAEARRHFEGGDLERAESVWRLILQEAPDHGKPGTCWARLARPWASWKKPRPAYGKRSSSSRILPKHTTTLA